MQLLTKQIKEQLLKNANTHAATPEANHDFEPVVKLFNPVGAGTWLLTELEPEDETIAWGLGDLGLGCVEYGTIIIPELEAYKGRLSLGIERDIHFKAEGPISMYFKRGQEAGTLAA